MIRTVICVGSQEEGISDLKSDLGNRECLIAFSRSSMRRVTDSPRCTERHVSVSGYIRRGLPFSYAMRRLRGAQSGTRAQ